MLNNPLLLLSIFKLFHHVISFLFVVHLDQERKVKSMITKLGLKCVEKLAALIIQKGDPDIISQNHSHPVLCVRPVASLHLCIHDGYHFPVSTLAEGLSKMLMSYYVLWIDYPTGVRTFFNFISNLHGNKIQVSKTMKELYLNLLKE